MGVPRILMRPASTKFFQPYKLAARTGYHIGRPHPNIRQRWMNIDSYIAGYQNGSRGGCCGGGWNWGWGGFGSPFSNSWLGKLSAGLFGFSFGFGMMSDILGRFSGNNVDTSNPYYIAQQQQQQLVREQQALDKQSTLTDTELNQVNGRYNLSA